MASVAETRASASDDRIANTLRDPVAAQAAACGSIVTLGVIPSRADTGYGYIKRGERLDTVAGAYRVERSSAIWFGSSMGSTALLEALKGIPDKLGAQIIERTEKGTQEALSACKDALDKMAKESEQTRSTATVPSPFCRASRSTTRSARSYRARIAATQRWPAPSPSRF